jgi:hypothetical protein
MVAGMDAFDPLKPFASEDAYQDFLTLFTDLEYKLYGKIDFKIVSKDDLEFDLYGGESHYTEKDLLALSDGIKKLNEKWKTEITYCLFPSKKYPGILINVRSPKAPFALVV